MDFERVDYFVEELTEKDLRRLLKKAGLGPKDVLRRREKLYRELNLADETDEDRLIGLIVANPSLLERPIVEVGERAVLARPIDRAIELITDK